MCSLAYKRFCFDIRRLKRETEKKEKGIKRRKTWPCRIVPGETVGACTCILAPKILKQRISVHLSHNRWTAAGQYMINRVTAKSTWCIQNLEKLKRKENEASERNRTKAQAQRLAPYHRQQRDCPFCHHFPRIKGEKKKCENKPP